jgi:hypothetical protein
MSWLDWELRRRWVAGRDSQWPSAELKVGDALLAMVLPRTDVLVTRVKVMLARCSNGLVLFLV